MHNLLTESKYRLDLHDSVNNISRNTRNLFGGDKLNVFITNPRDEIINGVELELTPFIPNQNLGINKDFPKISITEEFKNFNGMEGIEVTVAVIPEYSYSVVASFKAEFGKLTPSKEVIIPGMHFSLSLVSL